MQGEPAALLGTQMLQITLHCGIVLFECLREMMATLSRRDEVEVVRLLGMHDREQRLQARERDRRASHGATLPVRTQHCASASVVPGMNDSMLTQATYRRAELTREAGQALEPAPQLGLF